MADMEVIVVEAMVTSNTATEVATVTNNTATEVATVTSNTVTEVTSNLAKGA